MVFELNDEERERLSSLQAGLSEIRIYKEGLYPSVVSFVTKAGINVTVRAKDEDVAPRFEVFPITVSGSTLNVEPEQTLDCTAFSDDLELVILRKAEWSTPSTPDEQSQLLGDPKGATTQHEGNVSCMPESSVNYAILDAGLEIRGLGGRSFLIATSMFPFALYVSDCAFSESFDASIYDRLGIG